MRALTLWLLTIGLASPALAQLQPVNAPAPAAATTATPAAASTDKPTTVSGKIQIGYEKRSEYRNIKQPLSGRAAKPTEVATQSVPTQSTPAPSSTPSLNGHIMESSPTQRKPVTPSAKPFAATAPAATLTAAQPAKPRSDSVLRSDSSPAREAAAAVQAQAAAKAASDKAKAEALGAAIAAAQKAGAAPTGALPALPASSAR